VKNNGNNKIAGGLLMAAAFAFFIAAGTMRQPAFSGVGGALLVIGISITQKGNKR
jgi:hypothetical protein